MEGRVYKPSMTTKIVAFVVTMMFIDDLMTMPVKRLLIAAALTMTYAAVTILVTTSVRYERATPLMAIVVMAGVLSFMLLDMTLLVYAYRIFFETMIDQQTAKSIIIGLVAGISALSDRPKFKTYE